MSHARSASLTSLSLASPSVTASEVPTEKMVDELPETTIAQLVYAGRDATTHGFKAPTTHDIPQIRLPRLDIPDETVLDRYCESNVSQQDLGDLPIEASASELPPIDAVPAIFFDENFELDNPRVFDNVSSGDWAILQEQLGWYVDIVEMHLIHEISRASSGFFAATSTFYDIETQAAVISEEITKLRSSIAFAEEEVVGKAQHARRLLGKLSDINEFTKALNLVFEFSSSVDALFAKVSSSQEWPLDALQAVKDMDSPGLRSVKALQPQFVKLESIESQFREKYTQALSDVLLADLKEHLSSVSRSETLSRLSAYHSRRRARRPTLSAGTSESWRIVSDSLRKKVEEALAASAEASSTNEAFELLSDAVQREMKAVIKAHLPNNDDLAKSLHSLNGPEAEAMCQGLFTSISEAFRRLSVQEKLVLDVATQHGVAPPEQGAVLSTVLGQVDSRISRVLRVRKDPTAYLSASQYCRFYSMCRSFCEECEAITGQQPSEVTEFLTAQTKLFIHTLAADCESVLRTILDTDTWRKDEVLSSTQSEVDGIVECGVLDPSSWLSLGDVAADYSEKIPSNEKSHSNTVIAGSDSFFVSKSALQLASNLAEYLRLVIILPNTYAPDIAMAILELVNIFNTRARHLVLGFGATKTAGLRHISVRHLAVTSESLRFVIVLMPYIQQCISRHSVRDDLTLQFDSAVASLSEHHVEIHQKLVKLMTDKIQSCCRAIGEQNWGAPIEGEAHQYMLNLVKDTSTVARIVEDTLPAPLALALMTEVFDAYKPRLLEAYTAVTVKDHNEKLSLLKDLSYFREKAISIPGAGNIAEIIYETVDGFVTPDNPFGENSSLSKEPQSTPGKKEINKVESEGSGKHSKENEAKVKEEAERKAKEEAERKAKEEAELKAKEEAERKAKEEAERKAKEEAELKAKEEAEQKAKEEAELKAKEEAEQKAKEETELKAKEEAEQKAKEESALKAKEEAEQKAKEDPERKAKEEAEQKAKEEAEQKAKEEAERNAKEEAEQKAIEEAKQNEEAELKFKNEAEKKAKDEEPHETAIPETNNGSDVLKSAPDANNGVASYDSASKEASPSKTSDVGQINGQTSKNKGKQKKKKKRKH